MNSKPVDDIFKAIVSHMSEGVIFLDPQDMIRVCNPAAERIRGVLASRILGQSILSLHPPKMHHRILELLASLKSGTISSSNRIIHVNQRYFDNSYSAIRAADGEYLGTLLVSRDITEQKRLSEENLSLRHSLQEPAEQQLIAHSPAMQKVLEIAEAVAVLDSTVLVTGENGTGKERLVELIHRLSPRREGPLVRVNCAALPEQLVESELFGHQRGAFTGAVEDHKGKFELAHGGTLFLDEIGDLPLASQGKLLRAIQEKVVQPVGGRREIRVDVRIVAATNHDLARAVAEGRFRQDLYYRLNVITIEIPPLRERRDDVIPLAEQFIVHFCREMRRPKRRLSPEARALLLSAPLPGNVRQLRHAMERAVALAKGEVLMPADLPAEMAAPGEETPLAAGLPVAGQSLREAMVRFEKIVIGQALAGCGGRRGEAAQVLGISRKSLWEKLQRHGIDKPVT